MKGQVAIKKPAILLALNLIKGGGGGVPPSQPFTADNTNITADSTVQTADQTVL